MGNVPDLGAQDGLAGATVVTSKTRDLPIVVNKINWVDHRACWWALLMSRASLP